MIQLKEFFLSRGCYIWEVEEEEWHSLQDHDYDDVSIDNNVINGKGDNDNDEINCDDDYVISSSSGRLKLKFEILHRF